ncbi:nucleus protein [Trichosporon asahii var. asahii CBS 8904]|uniref:Nucleus protein n=1 Tax=Trichosporon asahii var. asahii (strain CBS 8904) TaxID=1220162 RepID=K1VPK2_TRIAC|nr:nucleus protein [Trichosporon asahii var. asahii CBS 8904]
MSTPGSEASPRPKGSPAYRKDNTLELKPQVQRVSQSDLAAEAEAKRRKVLRACDVCRRKKIRCEGPMNSQSNAKCANCQEYNLDCTYVEAAKRRGPPKGYIDTLEQRCARLERLVNQLNPAIDISETIGPMPDRDEFELSAYQETLRSLGVPPFPAMKNIAELAATPPNGVGGGHSSPRVLGPAPWKTYERDPHRPPEDEDEAREQARIAHAMVKLNIRDHDAFRFHGKASGAHLVRIVNELKYNEADATFFDRLTAVKRPEYWMVPEWEKVIATESVKPVDYSVWPDEDLAGRLIDGYFDHTNTHMPLLNRVIFQRQYQSGLWRTNAEFAKMCLLVFANGARYVDDERVYWPTEVATTPEGQDRLRNDRDGTLKYSAGWNYLRAVIKMGRSWLQGPSLLDLQTTVLVCLFMNGSAVPHLAWLVAGSGLRMAQEIGIHVRSTMLLTNPIDRALYNRAFWCLYHFDRLSCSAIGRSVAIQDSDFDADYPIPVDDEYWDTGDPEKDFRQPPGLTPDPAVTAFTHLLKLEEHLTKPFRLDEAAAMQAWDIRYGQRPPSMAPDTQQAVLPPGWIQSSGTSRQFNAPREPHDQGWPGCLRLQWRRAEWEGKTAQNVASLMNPNLGAPPTNAAGETIFPEFFDADNLHSMGFAVANFDMIAGNPGEQAPAPDFWTSLLRGAGPQGLGTFGGIGSNSLYAGLPSERERQQPWNFMPWLGHQGDVNMQAQAQANGQAGQGMGGQQQM